MTKGGLTKHLRSCDKRQKAIALANAGKGKDETIFHLQVWDAWATDFWLHLEMRSSATLKNLDNYLRAIWLECCGHLSAFHIGPYRYTQIFDDGWGMDDAKPMDIQVKRLFSPGMKIPYEYDFGTTSELVIHVVDARQGRALTANPIVLMARNLQPEVTCMECDQPGEWLCIECLYEYDEPGFLCDEHADEHPHDNYGEPVPVVNSPRVGLCGYEGPADPPY
ncbi:MAG: hypothetical protein ACE5FD_02665 [Anaerolineae bacterium]